MSIDWVPTYTRNGDTLAILMTAYGVSLNEILERNGLTPLSKQLPSYVYERSAELGIPSTFSAADRKKIVLENDINEWVHSRGGSCLPFKPGSTTAGRKLAGCVEGGYAVFNDTTEIMLPNKPRAGVPARPAKPDEGAPGTKMPVRFSRGTPWWVWALGALGLGIVVKKVAFAGKRVRGKSSAKRR